jgi:hypothetical protein
MNSSGYQIRFEWTSFPNNTRGIAKFKFAGETIEIELISFSDAFRLEKFFRNSMAVCNNEAIEDAKFHMGVMLDNLIKFKEL